LAACILLLGRCQTAPVERSAEGADERFQQFNSAARTAFHQGSIPQAERLYQESLNRAYIRDDLPAIVDAKYNLAVCRLRLGRYADALETIQSARHTATDDPDVFTAELWLLEAQILFRMGRVDDAWSLSEQWLAAKGNRSPDNSAMMHALRGRIACRKFDIQRARAELAAMGNVTGDLLLAEQAELSGCIALQGEDWQSAIRAFEEETSLRRRALHYKGMAEGLARAGLALEKQGDLGRAADRYLRAGRSAQLQDMHEEARTWLTRALTLASRVGDREVAREARERLSQLPSDP
jgi:tetratricopeptide (TPR) repeat protein